MIAFLRASPSGIGAAVVLAVLLLVAVVGPRLVSSPYVIRPAEALQSPSSQAYFGTDDKGRDMLARTVSGLGVSLRLGVSAAVAGVSFGLLFGLVTGYAGGRLDGAAQRFVESLLAFPTLLLAMAFTVALGQSLNSLTVILAMVAWPAVARIIHGSVRTLTVSAYVEAARSIGASPWRVLFRHILPNLTSLYIVVLTVAVGQAILTEASLSFLGLGVAPPRPSLGGMVKDGQQFFQKAPYLSLIPGLAVGLVVLSINSLGDALRDYLDPKLRKR